MKGTWRAWAARSMSAATLAGSVLFVGTALAAEPIKIGYTGPMSGSLSLLGQGIRDGVQVYVEYVNGEREFYDLASDPFELHNAVASLTPVLRERLHRTLDALKSCHDALSCWAAAHIR